MKIWEIYHYTYNNVCDDEWYGKTGKHKTLGFVTDSEENVKALVDKLNEKNHSYYEQPKPDNEYDEDGFWLGDDYLNEDYIAYKELTISTFEEIERRSKFM